MTPDPSTEALDVNKLIPGTTPESFALRYTKLEAERDALAARLSQAEERERRLTLAYEAEAARLSQAEEEVERVRAAFNHEVKTLRARLRQAEEEAKKLVRLRQVLRFESVTNSVTNEWSYVRDTVLLSSGEDYQSHASVVLDGAAAEALKAALAASSAGKPK